MATIICGNCKTPAASVRAVRACYENAGGFACDWLVESYGDEGDIYHLPCGAHAVMDARGWECEAGHANVFAEVRWAEGWDYCSPDEAEGLAKAGVRPLAMDGSHWLV